MRLALAILICLGAPPCLAAGPELPSHKPIPLRHTAGSKVGAFERSAYARAAPIKAIGTRWVWAYTFSPPQFATFRFYGRPSLDAPWVLIGANSAPVWNQYFTNGPVQYITCVAVDADMRFISNGQLK